MVKSQPSFFLASSRVCLAFFCDVTTLKRLERKNLNFFVYFIFSLTSSSLSPTREVDKQSATKKGKSVSFFSFLLFFF